MKLTIFPYSTHVSDSLLQYQIHIVGLFEIMTDEGVERRRMGLKLQVIFLKSIL